MVFPVALAAAAAMRSASSSVNPSGFSQWTCFPASSAASAISQWSLLGVVMETTSTSGSSTTARQSSVAFSKPPWAAWRSATSARRSHTETNLGDSDVSNTALTER